MDKNELLKKISETTDKEYLIDLFFEKLNEFDENENDVIDEELLKPLNKLDICVHIANKINSLSKDLDDEEKIELFNINLYLRNLYVLCLNQIERSRLELINKKEYDKDLVDSKINLGFGLIMKKVKLDKETLDYVSKEMIKDITDDKFENVDIEEDIHKKFKTKEQFEKNGIRKTIIDIIFKYDPDLSDYIAVNPNLVYIIEDRVNEYINDFDIYDEKRKYKLLMKEVKDYCLDNNLNYKSHILRISAEYNIFNKIISYSPDFKDENYNDLKEYVISESRNEIDENYEKIRKIFEKYLNESEEYESSSNVIAFKKGK